MNSYNRFRNECFLRIRQFGLDSETDFPPTSIGGIQFIEIVEVVELLEQLTAKFAARIGDARFGFSNKAAARENLRDKVTEIANISRSMSVQIPGIDLKFRVRGNVSDTGLLAAANAFYQESDAYKQDFTSYGLEENFRQNLKAAIDAFENAFGAPVSATEEQVAATAEIAEAVRRGINARKILDGIVKIKYKNNVGKLRAWTSASRITQPASKADDGDNGGAGGIRSSENLIKSEK